MENEKILTFRQFLTANFGWFTIDKQAEQVIKILSYWAWRHVEFEKVKQGYYLDKGILLNGNVGTGKTETMRLLQKYLLYLQSPYRYKTGIVWAYADRYKEDGYSCFNQIGDANWFFDELGLTDERTGEPIKEMVNNYGNKILVGQELIFKRYNTFKATGYQTHFTTNLTPKQLKEIYGERCFSRLVEMCNFIGYTGEDRRINAKPVFYSNQNAYVPESPQIPKEQRDADTKKWLNEIYQAYITTGTITLYAGYFEMFKNHGAEVATDEDLRGYRLEVETQRAEMVKTKSTTGAVSRDEHKRLRELVKQYANRTFDKEEESSIWAEAKKLALINYFNKCAENQQTTIF